MTMAEMTNPLTGIRYDSVTRQSLDRFVVTQGEDLDKPSATNKPWPALDGAPYVGGFASGERWWKRVTTPLPTIDFRFYAVDASAAYPTDPEPPIGYPSGEWRTTRETVQRPQQELFAMIDAAKKAANNTIYPGGDDPSTRALIDEARSRVALGVADATDLRVLEDHLQRIVGLKHNEEIAAQMRQAVVDEVGWDIEAGWHYGSASIEV